MNDKHDFGEYVGNNEGDLIDEFIQEQTEGTAALVYDFMEDALEYATKHDCRGLTTDEIKEAMIFSKKDWTRRFDEFCERTWESYRTSGPEPERD